MNRAIVIPAGCCLVALAVLLASLHGGSIRSSVTASANRGVMWQAADSETIRALRPSDVPILSKIPPISDEEARGRLSDLVDLYSRPWREWENSPHNLYTRAGPRAIPPISAEFVIDRDATTQDDNLLLAAITITVGTRSQHVPCVVDLQSK